MADIRNKRSPAHHFYRFSAAAAILCLIGVAAGCAAWQPPVQSSERVSGSRTVSKNIDAEIVQELNHARTNPPGYAAIIERRLGSYSGKEGKRAIQESIRVLRRTAPMRPLKFSSEVSKAARDHVRDQGRTGRTGHAGSDGSDPFTRIQRYVDTRGTAENIAYGLFTARDIVVELIIDDGVPSRGHRVNILNPNYGFVGVASGPHARYGFMSVMDFSYPYEAVASSSR